MLAKLFIGTWQADKARWPHVKEQELIKAIQHAIDKGITAFDTAEIYGNGYSEQVLGKAIGAKREQCYIASKVFAHHLAANQVKAACENSLKNLDTDYLDLYQIHWPAGSFGTPIIPIEETLEAMLALKDEGKIKAIGVSNFDLSQLQEACQYAPIVSQQLPYSLLWRHLEQDMLPYCIDKKIDIMAYSPLAQGLLGGNIQNTDQFAKDDIRVKNILFQADNLPKALRICDQLKVLAHDNHLSLAQLSLAWLIKQSNVSVISGSHTIDQVSDIAKLITYEMPDSLEKTVRRISDQFSMQIQYQKLLWDI